MAITIVKSIKAANVITHGGTFHSDDVIATVILSKLLGDLSVCRTFKVPVGIPSDVIVYDIGCGKFDHHQKGGNGFRPNGIPYASAGLLWKEFGNEIVANTCNNPKLVWDIVDKTLIQCIDAIDNGVMTSTDYPAHSMSVAQAISSFNPTWDSLETADVAFLKAVAFAETIFDNLISNAISRVKAEEFVTRAIEATDGTVMILDQYVPWQNALFASNSKKASAIQFVVFPSNREGYNWQCVPLALGSREHRKPVPLEWRGLTGSDLQKVSGISTAIFCHSGGFIGGALTLEDAIEMAKIASKN